MTKITRFPVVCLSKTLCVSPLCCSVNATKNQRQQKHRFFKPSCALLVLISERWQPTPSPFFFFPFFFSLFFFLFLLNCPDPSEVGSCSVEFRRWSVVGSCSISKAYSAQGRYQCQWFQKTGVGIALYYPYFPDQSTD